ncbi:hypothetical protein WOLCODRAFT_69214 [Wolfiporia cocos MD-104 SS10]|uniref:Uncharacterized protein n=1 Tax=Wolfiporia cocos (strain MD-104) TaxID=742152 RepID=A0A2H3JHB4_WOLCO|nr:hypothetical protein WOLCODRAFT_69214 [Wolfiporia cocos MD-104 SS10]
MAPNGRTRYSPPSSPTRSAPPPGFRVPPKPNATPISRMTVRELRDRQARNASILAQPTASTSAFVERIATDQAAIEARLTELVGVEGIRGQLEGAKIEDEAMSVDSPTSEQSEYRPIGAKQRALAKFASRRNTQNSAMTYEEAVRIEQEAHAADAKRRQELEDRRRRQGLTLSGESLTRQEREARMWAFMNYKPTESDLEDGTDDESDDDPAGWFEDDQDDGRKGQDIVEPDFDADYSHIIRIDESRIPYSIPRED